MLSLVLNMLYAHASNIGGSVPLLFIILVAISRRFMNKERLQIAFSRLEPTQPAIRKLPRQLRMRLDRKNEAEWFRKEASVYTLQQKKKVHTKPIFIRTVLKEHHRRLWILFYGTGRIGTTQVSFTRKIYLSHSNFCQSLSTFYRNRSILNCPFSGVTTKCLLSLLY